MAKGVLYVPSSSGRRKRIAESSEWHSVPRTVFISHSYGDRASKDKLLKSLPKGVIPVVFPREEPDPHSAVSNGIVKELRSCSGLIYLEGGRSQKSVWVNFERDYARRAGLKVFSFEPQSGRLREDKEPAVPLDVELIIGEDPEQRADELLRWMKVERAFVFDATPLRLGMDEVAEFVADLIYRKRTVIWLMDDHVSAIAELAHEIPPEYLYHTYQMDNRRYQTFFGRRSVFNDYSDWLYEQSLYVRLSPNFRPKSSRDSDIQEIIDEYPIERMFRSGWAVDLVPRADEGKIDWSRADDMIVRITLMLQQARPFFESEDEES